MRRHARCIDIRTSALEDRMAAVTLSKLSQAANARKTSLTAVALRAVALTGPGTSHTFGEALNEACPDGADQPDRNE
jgi:hypothetical protein